MLRFRCSLAVAFGLLVVASARAYVDLAPTLARIVRESQTITVAEVDRFSIDKGAVILKKVRDLKGETAADLIKHQVVRANESGVDRAILDWAEPGRRCVLFVTGKTAVVCIGEGWYQASAAEDGWWSLDAPRPDLPLAYYGTVSRLTDAVSGMLDGKSVVITSVPHGVDQQGASFELALNRAALPGLVRIQRVRVHLRMPEMALGVGANPAYVVGMGRAGREDIPALREQLRSADPTTRAEGAVDVASLGADGVELAPELSKLLSDTAPMVRMAAAAALLRIKPGDPRALDALALGLAGDKPVTRKQAARAVGLVGTAATPLVGKLKELLSDPDAVVRRTALQAIATLGPAAAEALEATTRLLEQPEFAVDAADALGRMGPAARPALKPLARMLSADAAAQRWAAVRAMAQIGGEEAAPAVKFIIDKLPNASEVDGYNMMIYLALLGPVAKEAIPAVWSSRVRNPVLRQTTVWAIDPGSELPALGPMGDSVVAQYILESYVKEVGDRLRPVAQALVANIMAGKAGNVPPWGYKLLAHFPEQSVSALAPALAEKDLAMRERAAVALGYMGRAARAAGPQVSRALAVAQDEREQRLLKWCLREIE
jgi:hypothetical protein